MVQTRRQNKAAEVAEPKLFISAMNNMPEASRFVVVGQFTNALVLAVQVLLNSNLKGEFWSKQNVFATAVFSTMVPVHWINVNFIYGASGSFLSGFKKVAPLMIFMAFAGTGITGVLERYTPLDNYPSILAFAGIGNVEMMTMLLVGCTNFLVTKMLLAAGGDDKKKK